MRTGNFASATLAFSCALVCAFSCALVCACDDNVVDDDLAFDAHAIPIAFGDEPAMKSADAPTRTATLRVVKRAAWDPEPLHAGEPYTVPLEDVYETIVVHHTDMDAPGPLAIKRYHLDVSGFSDIGYHFVIEPDGKVYEARDLDRVGANAGAVAGGGAADPDYGAIGVALDGTWDTHLPPREQLDALLLLVDDLRVRFPKIHRVLGHREVKSELVEKRGHTLTSHETTCPGDALFLWLSDQRVVGRFSDPPLPVTKLLLD